MRKAVCTCICVQIRGSQVKFAMVCAMLASFVLPAAAEGGRAASSTPSPDSTTVSTPSVTASLLPEAPAPANAVEGLVVLKTQPPQHRFFDVKNSLGLSFMASSLIADSVSTQKALAYPGFHEMNPVARPFMKTRGGAAAYTAGSFALLAGTAYALHKMHHHRLEHIFPFAVAGWEGFLAAHNYHVISAHQ